MKHHAMFIAMTVALYGFAACSSKPESGGSTSTTSSSGGPSAGCLTDPFSCAAGQTCWASKQKGFSCQPSGKGAVGDKCLDYFDEPVCGDGLTCFAVPGYPEVCTPFCDPKKPNTCPNGEKCQGLKDKNTSAVFYACLPGGSGAGGAGGGASSSSSSGGGGARPDGG